MKTTSKVATAAALAFGLGLVLADTLHADTFGSGANTFTIPFVTIGNAGNSDDAGAGGGVDSSPYGGVSYEYRMGVYEVPLDAITKATALGLANVSAGGSSPDHPAVDIGWYDAAAFVNWLNTSTGHQAAYNLSFSGFWSMSLWSSAEAWQAGGENLFRHKDAFYFLPSEDEWYKAAYHKNDGVTANYWDYPTGSNTVPDGIDFNGDTVFDAVFRQPFTQTSPNVVTNVGIASPYGTYGQGGNVQEWMESELVAPNDSPNDTRALRGGYFSYDSLGLTPSFRPGNFAAGGEPIYGFRVASVPEPSAALLVLAAGGAWWLRRLARRGR